MSQYRSLRLASMAAVSLAVLLSYASASAFAEEVMRIVHFTSGSLQQQQQAMTLVDTEINKLYRTAKGFKSVKYFMNAKTLETGSVSLWDSQASVEAFLKSDGYKPIAGKLKPLMVGDMSSVIYSVHVPK